MFFSEPCTPRSFVCCKMIVNCGHLNLDPFEVRVLGRASEWPWASLPKTVSGLHADPAFLGAVLERCKECQNVPAQLMTIINREVSSSV